MLYGANFNFLYNLSVDNVGMIILFSIDNSLNPLAKLDAIRISLKI